MEKIFKRFEKTLLKHVSEESIKELEKQWKQNTRFYHNISHLEQIIKDIESNIWFVGLSLVEKHTLLLGAFFHDAIYDPKKTDNEDQSIKFFKKAYTGKDAMMVEKVTELIEVSKHRKRPLGRLTNIFWEADNAGFKKGFDVLWKNDKLIQKEYKYLPKEKFKEGRIKFLESNIGLFTDKVDKDLEKLIEYYKTKY